MSCCLYWVILDERLSVRVLASAVDIGEFYTHICREIKNFVKVGQYY